MEVSESILLEQVDELMDADEAANLLLQHGAVTEFDLKELDLYLCAPGAMPEKLMPGTPSMAAGSTSPCQWIEVSSASRLVTRMRTRSPSRQCSTGPGRLPSMVVARRSVPVKLTG